jgi:hypothetical protein
VKLRQRRFRTRRIGALVTALASTGCGSETPSEALQDPSHRCFSDGFGLDRVRKSGAPIRFQHRCFSQATFTGSQSFSVWASIGGRLAGSQLKMSNRVPNGHQERTTCVFIQHASFRPLLPMSKNWSTAVYSSSTKSCHIRG